ncbi:MAG TPA: response regulator [Polyangiaceae bacterium]|nr:response regulator [Polyangiaceae bacterium]
MSQLESFRVLLVDDDARLLESMAAILAEQFSVRGCTSGPEALHVRDLTPFHVVCADWQMPSMEAAVQGDRK